MKTDSSVCVCVCVCVFVCMRACMYMCIYIVAWHIYIMKVHADNKMLLNIWYI